MMIGYFDQHPAQKYLDPIINAFRIAKTRIIFDDAISVLSVLNGVPVEKPLMLTLTSSEMAGWHHR